MAGLLTLPRFAEKRILTPTVTGGCAADPTCDSYNIFPAGPLAQVVRGAASNIAPSSYRCIGAEEPQWYVQTGMTKTYTNAWYIYGTGSMRCQNGGASANVLYAATAMLTPGQTYTISCFAYNNASTAKSARLQAYDATTGWTSSTVATVPAGEYRLFSLTFTYNAAGGAVYNYFTNWSTYGDFFVNAWQLTNTAYPLWFVNGSGTAMTQAVTLASLPIYAGGPRSWLFCFVPCWGGAETAAARVFYAHNVLGAANSLGILKDNATSITFSVWDAATAQKYVSLTALNDTKLMPGKMNVLWARRDAVGNMSLRLNRSYTASTPTGAGTGLEAALPALAVYGSTVAGSVQVNAAMHQADFNRYVSDAECDAIETELGVA